MPTKESIEKKIRQLTEVQLNIQHSITELVNVNIQLDREIEELQLFQNNL